MNIAITHLDSLIIFMVALYEYASENTFIDHDEINRRVSPRVLSMGFDY